MARTAAAAGSTLQGGLAMTANGSPDRLELALGSASSRDFITAACVDRRTGEVHWVGGDDPIENALPDDVDDDPNYARVPDKHELDLGNRLASRCARDCAPVLLDAVHDAFRRRGAWSRFKDMLDAKDLLQAWYEYENQATVEALTDRAEGEGFAVVA
jgi:hypothetical protein